jgi:chromosome segregation ATPase
MDNSTKHTPGPWFTKRQGFSTVYVEARLRDGWIQEVAACGPTEAGAEQQEANAAFIVRACNAYDGLVADNAALREDLNDARRGQKAATEDARDLDEQLAAAVRERNQYKHHVDQLIAETNAMRAAGREREAQLATLLREAGERFASLRESHGLPESDLSTRIAAALAAAGV